MIANIQKNRHPNMKKYYSNIAYLLLFRQMLDHLNIVFDISSTDKEYLIELNVSNFYRGNHNSTNGRNNHTYLQIIGEN